MKRMLIYMVVSLLMGALTACTGKQGDKGAERTTSIFRRHRI